MIKNCSHFGGKNKKFAKKYQYRCICDKKAKTEQNKQKKGWKRGKVKAEIHLSAAGGQGQRESEQNAFSGLGRWEREVSRQSLGRKKKESEKFM